MCQSQQTPEADNHQTIRSREHIPALDGVRGIAILMVMSHHFTIIGSANPVEKAVSGVLQLGWAGVDLFFVLSGYLITGILLDSKRSPHYYRNFYARRVLRIFPLYYAVVLLTFLVLPRLDGSLAQILSNTEGSIGWYITYLSNFAMSRGNHFGYGMLNVTWSLAIEEQFYLVWPLFVCVMRPQTLLRLCLSLIVGAPLLRLSLVLQSASWVTVYTMPFCRIDALAFGALVA
ncbi:MAG: acyltransferase, partial [Rhodopirellula sp.]|nr:acyltransferase [Rhodopirellula sp.]